MGSLSNSVFERRTSTGSRLFASLGSGLVTKNPRVNHLHKRKETLQYKFVIVKAYEKGEGLTSS